MRPNLLILLGFLAACLGSASLGGAAHAQSPQTVRPDGVAPRTAQFYGADDPLIELKNQVERLMGVYLCDPPRRHESERVNLKGKQVRVEVWQPVSRLSDLELKTRAVEWLAFGRTVYSTGARGIFGEMAGVDDLVLVFHEVIRPEEKGRRKGAQAEQIKRYMALRLTRDKFNRLDLAALEGCVSRADCESEFRTAFSQGQLDSRYTRSVRSDE